MLCHFLLTSMVKVKNCCPLEGCSPTSNESFLSGCFQDNFFPFHFQMFNGVDFFVFILFGVYSASWICRIVAFAKFESFSAIILILFQFYLLSLLLGLKWYNVGSFIIAQRPPRFCSSFSVYFLYAVQIG